jgi:DNA polymerase III subunit delta
MSVEKIISDFKQKKFKPFYWLEGEEPFFIDEVMHFAEHHILSEAEASFNLSVFYGRDAHWVDIMNTCRKYPMNADLQVVLLKEAQHMKDLEKLEPYFENPLKTTVFVVSYKDKKVDGRSKLSKTLKQKGELVTTKKIYDNQLPDWASNLIQQHGLTIQQKALFLLIDHIGNDLSRIKNEIEKMAVNLNGRKNVTEEDIETYIGISKEFNVFELQDALGKKNTPKAIRILQYFESNPKAAPVPMMLPALYNFFSKVYMIFGIDNKDERSIATSIGVNPYYIKDYLQSSRNYGQQGIEKILLLLHQYNLRSVGVNNSNTSDAGLIKELVMKMIA